jgi:hypothetical protein
MDRRCLRQENSVKTLNEPGCMRYGGYVRPFVRLRGCNASKRHFTFLSLGVGMVALPPRSIHGEARRVLLILGRVQSIAHPCLRLVRPACCILCLSRRRAPIR